MMNKAEMVSFIILTYKKFDGIYDTLDSLFIQDYPCIELIVCDDGSPNYDDEIDKIKDYIDVHKKSNIVNVRFQHNMPNMGTVQNANVAYRMAEGKYIKDLGADDELNGVDAISKYVRFIEENNAYICFSKLQGIDDCGNVIKSLESCVDNYDEVRNLTPMETRNKLFARNFLPAPAWFAKKELFEKYGYYLDVTRLIEDYPYWIHLCTEGVEFKYMDDVLINYKMTGVSSAGSYGVAFMEDMFNIYDKCIFPYDKRYGFAQPLYNFLKKMGLNAYNAKAYWDTYGIGKKLLAYIKYGVFFAYIKLGNYKNRKKNIKNAD